MSVFQESPVDTSGLSESLCLVSEQLDRYSKGIWDFSTFIVSADELDES